MDDAEKDYKKALSDMPGQWSLLLTQVVVNYRYAVLILEYLIPKLAIVVLCVHYEPLNSN